MILYPGSFDRNRSFLDNPQFVAHTIDSNGLKSATARRFRAFLLALILGAAAGCSAVMDSPPATKITGHPVFRPKMPQQVTNLQEAIATILTACDDLGLPPVDPLYLQLYINANAYAYYARDFAPLPKDFVPLTVAQAYGNKLYINLEQKRGQTWASLLRRLAHDYGHNVQYVLAGRPKSGRQWMTEGFADWVAAKVMDKLEWESYASSLSRARREIARYGAGAPRLSQLESAAAWAKALEQEMGRVKTYHVAFLAVDRLIEKHGIAAMMNYFATEDFSAAFGTAPADFERQVQALLAGAAGGPASGNLKADKPDWKPGYEWQYALKAPGLQGAVLLPNKVVREETFEDVPAYVVSIGTKEYPHAKETLGVLATLSEGKTISKNTPPSQPLAWPLEVGKQWSNDFAMEAPERKGGPKIETEIVVGAAEEVRVPAGVFQALRVETYAAYTGELVSEQWYAPRVKWLVRSRVYREEGVIEQQLVDFKID